MGKESKMILAVVEFVVAETEAETDFKIIEIYRGMVSFSMSEVWKKEIVSSCLGHAKFQV